MTPRQPHSRFARNERCQFLQGEILADEERDGIFMKPGSLRCAKRSFLFHAAVTLCVPSVTPLLCVRSLLRIFLI